MTVVALALGLIAGNVFRPGAGFDGEPTGDARAEAKASIEEGGGGSGFVDLITGSLLPESFVQPFVDNEILRVLVLAILVAAAISGLPSGMRERIVGGFGDGRQGHLLTSKGAAGITGAGLVTLTASLQAFGGTFFSAEALAVGIALVVGIDRNMSEGRAITNAIGNATTTMVIAKWQGERDDRRFQAALDDPSEVNAVADRAMAAVDEDDTRDEERRFTGDGRSRQEQPDLVIPGRA